MTTVVHCKRQPFTTYIGRPSKWGNPFKIINNTRGTAIQPYRDWLFKRMEKEPDLCKDLLALEGEILGCWCKPHACHGDIIVEAIKHLKSKK